MTIEVINGSATLDGTEQTIGSTTAFHPRASVYLPALGGNANVAAAKNSVWRIYSISDGITSLLASGIWADPTQNTVLLANVPAQGATIKLTVQAAQGAGVAVAASLVGWDQGDQITPATLFANGSITLTNAEQDVCALAGAYTLQNVTVNPNSDPLAERSIWRLYGVVNGVRYQIGSGRVRKENLLQQALISNVVTGAQSYVLTAQGGFGNSAVSVTGVIFGSSDSTTGTGGGGGGGGLPALGDVIINPGDATKNDVVKITGDTTNGNLAVVVGALGFGTVSATTAGLIRVPDLSTPQVIIGSSIGGVAAAILQLFTSNSLQLGSANGTTTIVGASSGASFQSGSMSASFRSDVGGFFISGASTLYKIIQTVGAYTFTSDANLTGYDFNLNGGNSLLGIRANWNIGDITASAINFDGTNINFKNTSGANVAQATASKWITVKGIRRAVRSLATAAAVVVTDDVVMFTANAQTATLPASPTTGDKYTIGCDLGLAATYTINGNGKNVVGNAASGTTLLITASAAGGNQVTSVMYDGSVWVAATGY